MIFNYLTIAWRGLIRQHVYSAINIFGLTTGVAACFLILLYVADELSYDRLHPDAERIYRVNFKGRLQQDLILSAQVGLPMAEAIQNEAAGIEAVTRVDKWMTCPVRYEDRAFTEMNLLLADSNFFSFFNYKLVAGNPRDVLLGPGKIVISERAAQRYFDYKGRGDLSPLGKTLVIGSEGAIFTEVTGIAENPPDQTHMHFDFLMSLPTSGYANNPMWMNFEVFTYVKLVPGTRVEGVQQTLDGFVSKYCAPELEQSMRASIEDLQKQGGMLSFNLQPMVDIHLKSEFQDGLEPHSDIEYVYLFSAVALFIVLLACINFMNLSTARSANRAKEVGVRKTVGAVRGKLMGQFFTESSLYCLIAFLLAFALVHVMLGPFNQLAGKNIHVSAVYHPYILASFVLLALLIALLSGSYPALYLTSFRPSEVLKGRLRMGSRNARTRNGLVIFQFFVSIGLIISAMMVYFQLQFLQNQDLGFQKENVVGLMHTMNLGNDAEAFKEEILKYPDFVAASFSSRLPPNVDWGSTFRTGTGDQHHMMSVLTVDHDFLQTMGLSMAEGRFFSREFPADTVAVVINETAARIFGMDMTVGSDIRYTGNDEFKMKIVGVVKDFNFESLKAMIRPIVLFLDSPPNWDIAVRLSAGNPAEKIARLGEIWKKFAPKSPFEYSFIDQNFEIKFRAEQRLGNVILVFTALAIFIACLGLLGLATFTAEQRSKEISIRKVFGASVSQMVVLLSRDFVRLIFVALLIAVPVTWYGVNRWLEGFPYRIEFNFSLVVLAGAIALAIAMLTVSYQAVRAALENPVKSLKSE